MGGPDNLVKHFNLTPNEYLAGIGNLGPRGRMRDSVFMNPVPVVEPIVVQRPSITRVGLSKPVRFVGPSPVLHAGTVVSRRPSVERRPQRKVAQLLPNVVQPPSTQNILPTAPPSGYSSQYRPSIANTITSAPHNYQTPSTRSVYRNPVRHPQPNYGRPSLNTPAPRRFASPQNRYPSSAYNQPQQPYPNYNSNVSKPRPNEPYSLKKSILKNAIPDVLSGKPRPDTPSKRVKFSPYRKVADERGLNHLQRERNQRMRPNQYDLNDIDGVGGRGNYGYYN